MSDLISRSTTMENYCNALCPKLQKGEYCNDCIVKAWLNNQPTAYSVDKVVEELEELRDRYDDGIKNFAIRGIIEKAIEIVKQGGVSDDVCEWKLEDGEANLYLTGCQQRQLIFEGTPKENGYRYCTYCGKKIKVVK